MAQGKSYDTSCANQNLYTELNIAAKRKPLSFPLNYDLLEKKYGPTAAGDHGSYREDLKKILKHWQQCCCPFVSIMHVLRVYFI